MIFVILGTHERPFLRLVKEIDRLSLEEMKKEKFIVQLGFTKYKFKSKNVKSFRYAKQKEFDRYLNQAKILITHGGSGSILEGIRKGIPIIAVPRLARYGEHVNDHQLQIVKEMEGNNSIIPLYDISELRNAIEKSGKMKSKKITKNNKIILNSIEVYLKNLEKEISRNA